MPDPRRKQKAIPRRDIEIIRADKHFQFASQDKNQFPAGDGPGDMPSVSARDESSAVVRLQCNPHEKFSVSDVGFISC